MSPGGFRLALLSLPPSAAGLTEALGGTDLSRFRSAGTGASHPAHCTPCVLHSRAAAGCALDKREDFPPMLAVWTIMVETHLAVGGNLK